MKEQEQAEEVRRKEKCVKKGPPRARDNIVAMCSHGTIAQRESASRHLVVSCTRARAAPPWLCI